MRAWADDPTTPLDHLPPLANDTYTPETFQRLLLHVTLALESVTNRWVRELGQALSSWRTPFDLAHSLVQLRSSLARRVQLSRHPSLPPAVREALVADAATAIQGYQRELEQSVRESLARTRLSAADRETILQVVRENSFTRTLDIEVSQSGTRQTMSALPEIVATSERAPANRFSHRRLPPRS